MRRALVLLGVLVVAALATLFVGPILIDWDRYRGAIEEEASRRAGRDVRIGGQIQVRLLPVPYIHIGRLRVADTTAAIGEPLFKAEALTMRLALSPLIAGSIEARHVELSNPVLNIVLDDKGGGNWASLARLDATNSLPGSVAFDDISITEGSLVVRAPNGAVRAQFNQIAGSVSATALEGPYRVQVTYAEPETKAVAGAKAPPVQRELRLSTARQDADGGVRFKGAVRSPASGHSWAVDGAVHDLLGRLRVDGNLTARIPFIRSDTGTARGRASQPAVVEVKSSLRADTASMELADFNLTIDADNKPQLANGAARFSWGQLTTAEILVKARWIDIDRIIGTDANTASTATLARMIAGLGDALPGTDQLRALVLLDQATLNGDIISALKADIQKNAAGYEIRELSGNLPGSARLILSGRLNPEGAQTQFEGPVTLRGASFNRFVAWAGRGLQPPEIARDGPFALDGQLTVGPQQIGAQNVRLEVPGGRLGGDASWSWGAPALSAAAGKEPPPSIVLALDGPSLDIGALLPSEPRPGALLRDIIASVAPSVSERPTSTASQTPSWPSADVKLRFGRLATRAGVYDDVDAELRWDGKSWRVPRLRAAGSAGWRVDLEGDLAGFNESNPAGTIAGIVTSPDRAALAELLALLEIPATGILEPDRLARIAPLRLAGRLLLKPKTATEPASARLIVDGDVGESRVAATVSTPRRSGNFADQPLEIDIRADAPAITSLLAQIAPDDWTAPPSSRMAVPARLTFTAVGQLGEGLQTLALIESAGLRGELRGRLKAPPSGSPDLTGTLQLRADDLAHLLATSALGRSERLAGVPLAGRMSIALNDKRLKLETDDLALSDTRVSGSIDLDYGRPTKRIDAKITSSRVDLSRVLMPILDERLATAVQQPQRVDAPSWWPEAPFNLDRLGALEGTLALDAAEFVVANGIALRQARLETTIKPGALDIRLADANASGGKAAGRFTLAKAPAGVTLKGALRIDGAEVGATIPGKRPSPVGGRVQLIVDVSGTALTARGLVASLSGNGEIRLSDAVLNHLSPAAITEASAIVLGPEGTLGPGSLEKLLRDRLSGEPLQLGRRRIALTISDGHARTAPLIAETKAGRVNGTLIVDLDSQRIDSEWKLDGANVHPRKGAKPKGPLPAVTIVWAGPLARVASIEPQFQLDALERELSVRRMEGEVDELERLRKLDEDRARQEAERQRVIDAERQREADRLLEEQRAREGDRTQAPTPMQTTVTPATPGSPLPAASAPPGSQAIAEPSAQPAAVGNKPGEAPSAAEAPPAPAPAVKPAPRPQARKRPFNPFGEGFSQ